MIQTSFRSDFQRSLSFNQSLDLSQFTCARRSNFGYFPPSTALNYDSLSPEKTPGLKFPDSRLIVGQVGGIHKAEIDKGIRNGGTFLRIVCKGMWDSFEAVALIDSGSLSSPGIAIRLAIYLGLEESGCTWNIRCRE